MWRSVRSPFRIPVTCRGHACTWEAIDHHLAGCTGCGRVHRCDGDQSDAQREGWWACRGECTEDGSTVCTITGVCIRACSFAVEYDLLTGQGLTQDECSRSGGFDAMFTTSHPRRPPGKRRAEMEGAKKRNKRCPPALKFSDSGPFVPKISHMKGGFGEQNIQMWCRRLVSAVSQETGKIFSRHMDSCDRRDAILESILAGWTRGPVCLLSVAATMESRCDAVPPPLPLRARIRPAVVIGI